MVTIKVTFYEGGVRALEQGPVLLLCSVARVGVSYIIDG